LKVSVTVVNGLVEDVVMRIPPTLMMSEQFVEDLKVMTSIRVVFTCARLLTHE